MQSYASTVLAVVMCLSVHLSIHHMPVLYQSHAVIVSKWLMQIAESRKQCHMIVQGLQFSDAEGVIEIRIGSPLMVVLNAGRVG